MGIFMDYKIVLSGDKTMMFPVAAELATASGFCFDIEEFERNGCQKQNEIGFEFDVSWCGSGDAAELEVHICANSWLLAEEAFNEILLNASHAGVSVKYIEYTDDQGWWTKCVGYEKGEREEYLGHNDLFIPDWDLARDAGLALEGDPVALDRLFDAFASPEFDDEYYIPTRLGLAEIIQEAGGTPRPEHAEVWMKCATAFREMADDVGGEMWGLLQDREDLIDWMQSMAEAASLSAKGNPAGGSARRSEPL